LLKEYGDKVRVYNFDADVELSATQTLKKIYSADKDSLPILVVDGKTFTGFKSYDELLDALQIDSEKEVQEKQDKK